MARMQGLQSSKYHFLTARLGQFLKVEFCPDPIEVRNFLETIIHYLEVIPDFEAIQFGGNDTFVNDGI